MMNIKMSELKLKLKEAISKWCFTSIDEPRMAGQWRWITFTWIAIWIFLIFISSSFNSLIWISHGVLAIHLTKWARQGFKALSPVRFINDTKRKAVFITGCDTGFGHLLAVKLDKLGFKVFAGCLSPEGTGAKDLREKTSENLQILNIDVTDNATITEAYDIVKRHCDETKDCLWALVNNAGIAVITEVEWCSLEVYQKIMDVNALGVIRTTKAFLPILRKARNSRVIIVASLAGRFTMPGYSAYAMSKHAAVSFADGLRLEMKKWDITVHTVEPTLYSTSIIEKSRVVKNIDDLWEKCPDNIKKSYGKEYLEAFKLTIDKQMLRAKPEHKIHEVIDAMVHAVAGEDPECRYVPSLPTQMRVSLMESLPVEILDEMLGKSSPKSPPADVEGFKNTRFRF